MRKRTEEKMGRLRKALSVAYLEREAPEIGENWQLRVMNQIQSKARITVLSSYLELLEGFVWRYAPIACLLIFILTAAIIRLDFISEYALVQLFSEDPLDYSLFGYAG